MRRPETHLSTNSWPRNWSDHPTTSITCQTGWKAWPHGRTKSHSRMTNIQYGWMKPEEAHREWGERERGTTGATVLCVLHLLFVARHFAKTLGGAMADTAGSGADDVDPFAFVPKVRKNPLLALCLSVSSTSWSPLNESVLLFSSSHTSFFVCSLCTGF